MHPFWRYLQYLYLNPNAPTQLGEREREMSVGLIGFVFSFLFFSAERANIIIWNCLICNGVRSLSGARMCARETEKEKSWRPRRKRIFPITKKSPSPRGIIVLQGNV